ncbi:hypothetical protein J2Y48_004664 [Mycoplana sp. BE70]|nr:hypothetical protein [Mycoplana sp. BE70]
MFDEVKRRFLALARSQRHRVTPRPAFQRRGDMIDLRLRMAIEPRRAVGPAGTTGGSYRAAQAALAGAAIGGMVGVGISEGLNLRRGAVVGFEQLAPKVVGIDEVVAGIGGQLGDPSGVSRAKAL